MGAMSIEKLANKVRREQIARAALHLLATQGLSGLSMAALARQVGLVPSAIYRHFRSKEDVLDAVVDALRQRLLGNVRLVTGEADDPLDQLRRLMALHVRLILEHHSLPRMLFSGEIYAGRPERKAKLLAAIQAYLAEVAAIIRGGQEGHLVRSDVSPETAALLFLGVIQPAAILWHLSDGEFDAAKHVERAWPLFRQAIAVD
jgi:AcrR family transcriptional regulator